MKIETHHPDGTTTERKEKDQILTFQEGEMWIAAWRHYDVVTQGETEREAAERLLATMGQQCLWDAMDGRRPYEDVKPPTADVLAEWERKHREAHT